MDNKSRRWRTHNPSQTNKEWMKIRAVKILKLKRKLCKNIERRVPISHMQKGIDLCLKNIADYLLDAKIIINEDRPHHALISAQFAIEELGKMLLLKESLKNCNNATEIEINGEKFCDHHGKAEKAWNEVLDRKYQIIFVETWDNSVWDEGKWDGKTAISHATRLNCAFVDYINNEWTCEAPIDKTLFQDFLTHFEAKMKAFSLK